MKEISVFDVIGPNMIGPSSSHTAGALKIALLAKKIAGSNIESVEFTLYGSFAHTYKGHGTDKALLAGILGFDTEDKRIKNSYKIADEKGLKYNFTTDTKTEVDHPNTVKIVITSDKGDITSVIGESIGGANIIISSINDIKISFTGEYHTIIVKQIDRPGVIAHITSSLASYNINIAFMKLFRSEKGLIAYTIIEADDVIDKNVLELIKNHEFVETARLIEV